MTQLEGAGMSTCSEFAVVSVRPIPKSIVRMEYGPAATEVYKHTRRKYHGSLCILLEITTQRIVVKKTLGAQHNPQFVPLVARHGIKYPLAVNVHLEHECQEDRTQCLVLHHDPTRSAS